MDVSPPTPFGCMDGCMDGWMDGWMDGGKDGTMDGELADWTGICISVTGSQTF